jgi:hypothetical protein
VRGQIRGDAIGPGQVCRLVVVGLPRGNDFDHVVGPADTECSGLERYPGGRAVKVVHRDG